MDSIRRRIRNRKQQTDADALFFFVFHSVSSSSSSSSSIFMEASSRRRQSGAGIARPPLTRPSEQFQGNFGAVSGQFPKGQHSAAS